MKLVVFLIAFLTFSISAQSQKDLFIPKQKELKKMGIDNKKNELSFVGKTKEGFHYCCHLNQKKMSVHIQDFKGRKCSIIKDKYSKVCTKCKTSIFKQHSYCPIMILDTSGEILYSDSNTIAQKDAWLTVLVQTKFKNKGRNEFIFVFPYNEELSLILAKKK